MAGLLSVHSQSRFRHRLASPLFGSPGFLFFSLIAALLLIVSRRLDVITHAQFYGEDGLVWYAQAYSLGPWHALLLPRDGYFQTLPRLAAMLALLVPLSAAPLVMNLTGLFIQALPVPLLLSQRMEHWVSLPLRFLMALTYLALPNTAELHVSVTEAHWHLALAACLLILAAPARRSYLDCCLLLLAGLSGPFAIPLCAIALLYRNRWWKVLVPCATLQAGALILSGSRPKGTLGATSALFLQMIVAQVYAGSLVGRNSFHRANIAVLVTIAVAGSAIILYCFFKAPRQWRLLLLFCSVVFAGSLLSPNAGAGASQWLTVGSSWDNRYWFFALLAFVWSLCWCATSAPTRLMRVAPGALLLIMLLYLPKTWRLKPADDVGFAQAALAFEHARPGETVTLPVLPAGWTMQLQKR